ncbi:MAG TPA: NUDIX hydrolase [Wenzhouxiangellaceae bacterium]|nr:NUDIX hydrolase [Wenzhouxiangellaceae bacterium]
MTPTSHPMPFELSKALQDYCLRHPDEAAVVDQFRSLITNQPECFERGNFEPGHVTGSAWLVDGSGEHVLLTHHRKLDAWLQLGGHSDGDPDTAAVAGREAEEESGLAVELISRDILDIDVHEIPARKSDPAHFHFDVRFAFVSRSGRDYVVSDESHDLAWVPVERLRQFTTETSILRMAKKWTELRAQVMGARSTDTDGK